MVSSSYSTKSRAAKLNAILKVKYLSRALLLHGSLLTRQLMGRSLLFAIRAQDFSTESFLLHKYKNGVVKTCYFSTHDIKSYSARDARFAVLPVSDARLLRLNGALLQYSSINHIVRVNSR